MFQKQLLIDLDLDVLIVEDTTMHIRVYVLNVELTSTLI